MREILGVVNLCSASCSTFKMDKTPAKHKSRIQFLHFPSKRMDKDSASIVNRVIRAGQRECAIKHKANREENDKDRNR